MSDQRWARPAAGKEPAAAALLGWLADEHAPRMCLLSGSENRGKSQLLAWLIAHGTRPGTRSERRIHSFVPLSGQSALTTTWVLAEHLKVSVRTPGELLTALAADERRTVIVLPDLHAADDPASIVTLIRGLLELGHVRLIVEVRSDSPYELDLAAMGPAIMNLDEPQWTDQHRHRTWHNDQLSQPRTSQAAPAPEPDPDTDLDDARAVCRADPWTVSRRYTRSIEQHGGLREAWLRAAASLTRDQSPEQRALVLAAALGDDADPRLAHELAEMSTGCGWTLRWNRVRGDLRPPWPGPVRALATGRRQAASELMVADHSRTVRIVDATDASAAGRIALTVEEPSAIALWDDGTVLLLDCHGRMHAERRPNVDEPTGLQALLEDGPTRIEQLLAALTPHTGQSPARSVAAGRATLAYGDAEGNVRVYQQGDNTHQTLTKQLHDGPVTGLACVELEEHDPQNSVHLLYSGGADGTVRAWRTDVDPLAKPVISRPCPVTALSATRAPSGLILCVSWGDGLVEHRDLDSGARRQFVPGAPVYALALTSAGDLVVGTDDSLICLRPADLLQPHVA